MITARSLLLAPMLACWLTSPHVLAEVATHPAADILGVAKAFLEQATHTPEGARRTEITLDRLDPRLRLTLCTQPLQAFQPAGARLSGRTSVAVRCPDNTEWTVYVPAEIKIFGQALMTTRSLGRGAEITAGDIKVVEADLSRLTQGHLQSSEEIQGMVTRRPLASDTLLMPSMLKAPRLIRRGDQVKLINSAGPIQVEMLGEAINDGARGDRVRVRALNSQRVVEGWVVSDSVVKVTL